MEKSILKILKKLKRDIRQRRAKAQTLKAIESSQDDLKVIIGSASTEQNGWISTNYPLLDLTNENTFSSLFKLESVSNFLAEHVWEHLSREDGVKACRNCFNFLKKNGKLRIAVPDGLHTDDDYIAQVKPGGYGAGSDDHKVLYDYHVLSEMLIDVGFKVILLEWFDKDGEFHFVDWNVVDGMVRRSTRFDARNNQYPTAYTSLIIDAIKP